MTAIVKRVEICGGIAAGKTTLARLLRSKILTPIYEDFKKNPFYDAFYEDPRRYAFETELTFLLQHYHQQKAMASKNRDFCADFSLVLDCSYARVTLTAEEGKIFQSVHARAEHQLPARSLLVHLTCAPSEELNRIRRRRRHSELSITLEYLQAINKALAEQIQRLRKDESILAIDSGAIDFAHDRDGRARVRERVLDALTRY
jgi:deoxyguanosine kinase